MAEPSPRATQPSANLMAGMRQLLMQYVPFSRMQPQQVDEFLRHAHEVYFAPQQRLLEPASGPVHELYFIRQGAVTGEQGVAALAAGSFEFEAGDLFPVSAVLGERPVTATYTATEDTFCLRVPVGVVRRLVNESAPFADALNRRVAHLLELSQQALQTAYSSQLLAEQSMHKRLGEIGRKAPHSCEPGTPLRDVLQGMDRQRVGSVVVVDDRYVPVGIFTRHDVLSRVALAGVPLDTPVSAVMSQPVQTLGLDDRAQDAALLMSVHGVRHVPLVDASGHLAGVVSERDLFAMQRVSLKSLGSALRTASSVATLRDLAGDLRSFAKALLGQGVQARQLTELISHLNDLLTRRLIELKAREHGRDLSTACWLAFGSEGRGEQTIATDQDNGLIFESDQPAADRPAWLAFARGVNEALDACGYPLCKGNIMAGNPECCLTPAEWLARLARWIDQGSPEDLLAANIFFDLRPLAGRLDLAQPLRRFITTRARAVPRFCKQLAVDALRNRAPLNWHGGIEVEEADGRQWVDLKLRGTAIFVDAARLQSLALGIDEVNTRRRLEAVERARTAAAAGEPAQEGADEAQAAAGAFEYLQMLRLRVQIDRMQGSAEHPNRLDITTLNAVDRRILKESFRVAHELQQRLELDYLR
jgi:CBS domain-containing protein